MIRDKYRNSDSGDVKLISTLEAATILQVTAKSIQRWIDDGEIPAHKTAGGHRRILQSDLLDYARKKRFPLSKQLAQEQFHVVIADDDSSLLEIMEDILLNIDPTLSVYKAEGGFLAGALVAKHRPQLVLLDILMPGLQGISVCRWIKSNDTTKHAHVIGVTSARSKTNHDAMLDAGAAEIVLKPVGRKTLEDILNKYGWVGQAV